MNKNDIIYVAWGTGLVGGAIVRTLKNRGYTQVVIVNRSELDLLDAHAVNDFYARIKPKYVINSAARVGGIKANMTYKADFLYENLAIQNNVIWWAHLAWVEKLVFLGSSCIYPRNSPQPMKEEYFMEGRVEPTNEGYAIAKIAGMKLCETLYEQYGKRFISCMPTNVYGPGDHFDSDNSHVIPGMIRRMHEAKQNNDPDFLIWGSGNTRREFLYVEDLAEAVVWMLENYEEKEFVNIGTGEDISINELAVLLKEIIEYQGVFAHDTKKPDGFPKKLLDITRLEKAWWKSTTKLHEWLCTTYKYFLEHYAQN